MKLGVGGSRGVISESENFQWEIMKGGNGFGLWVLEHLWDALI